MYQHHSSTLQPSTSKLAATEEQRDRVGQMLRNDPESVAAWLGKSLEQVSKATAQLQQQSFRPNAGAKFGAIVPDRSKSAFVAAEGDILSESELRSFYSFVGSSGRCRRDCPELYAHMTKRMIVLRHEDGLGRPIDSKE